jgi:hypothetical protein
MNDVSTFQAVARELAGAFVVATRANGAEFLKLGGNCPAWVADIPRAAHEAVDGPDPRAPSDWIYRLASRAADFAAENESAEFCREGLHDFCESSIDVYASGLFSWAADNTRNRDLCDSAAEEFGGRVAELRSSSVEQFLSAGQYLAADRVLSAIIEAIEAEAENRPE